MLCRTYFPGKCGARSYRENILLVLVFIFGTVPARSYVFTGKIKYQVLKVHYYKALFTREIRYLTGLSFRENTVPALTYRGKKAPDHAYWENTVQAFIYRENVIPALMYLPTYRENPVPGRP